MSAIDVQELCKIYSDGSVALDGLSFDVPPGEIFGCLGRNGAGKSTSVRVLTTLTRATSGTVRVLGMDVSDARAIGEIRAQVGLSLQQAALDQLMTGREHLQLMARLRGIRRAEARHRVDELLDRFGLGSVADRYVATYTIGIQRRLDTAMALLHRPILLFLDEPTTGLDPQSRRALWGYIKEFRADGGTVFLTTQYLDEADELCDRIAILDSGRVCEIDTPAALKQGIGGKVLRIRGAGERDLRAAAEVLSAGSSRLESGVLEIFLSARETEPVDILTRLRAAGVPVSDVVIADPTIEEVFVRLTGESVDTRGLGQQAAGVAAIGRTLVSRPGGGAR